MHYKYYVVLYFRNGSNMSLYSNDVSLHEGPNSSQRYLWVDGKEIVAVKKANPHSFREGETFLYDGSPLTKLWDMMPTEWDKDVPSLKIIDKIVIDSKGRTIN